MKKEIMVKFLEKMDIKMKKKTHTHTSLADITSYTQIYKRV